MLYVVVVKTRAAAWRACRQFNVLSNPFIERPNLEVNSRMLTPYHRVPEDVAVSTLLRTYQIKEGEKYSARR